MTEQFKAISEYAPAGDQPEAIRRLIAGLKSGAAFQTLKGVTGSGKTFTMAKVVEAMGNRPVLVLSHNKTLAAQLYSEFKAFFPYNAVEYFISYYDYYLPESYIPQTDTYIAKDASINDNIERLRLSATASMLERRDVLTVASVSCIYGLTAPEDYSEMSIRLAKGQALDRNEFLRMLVAVQYERNDFSPERGQFRVRGDTVEIHLSQKEKILRIEFWGPEIDSMSLCSVKDGKIEERLTKALVFPAKHFVLPQDRINAAVESILAEMKECVHQFELNGKLVEAQRLYQRVTSDVEMMKEIGYCSGIENYSRHLAGRTAGSRPYCLLDFFPGDYLLFIDESHVTLPQLQAMYKADRSRKQTLVDYGFRLPSALDNRPLKFEEFLPMMGDTVFVSATPGDFELEHSGERIVEQIVRPTGLPDPPVEVRPLDTQIDDVIGEIRECAAVGARSMVATLTKKSAERLADYLGELGIRVKYIHSEIDAIERVGILNELRRGDFDCIVGINLLREGIDLPELRLVAILDADKEGFLRSAGSLVQIAGRAARNADGYVILYADQMTDSIRTLLDITRTRRDKQLAYNRKNGIVPRTVVKAERQTIAEVLGMASGFSEKDGVRYSAKKQASSDAPAPKRGRKKVTKEEANDLLDRLGGGTMEELITMLEQEMLDAAEALEFERAASIRDRLKELRGIENPGK